jgi:hypothetical protein
MPYTEEEAKELFFQSAIGKALLPHIMETGRMDFALLEAMDFAGYFYVPSDELKQKIDQYLQAFGANQKSDILLEQVAFLTFLSLKAPIEIESYQSYAPQLDLVVSGVAAPLNLWRFFMEFIGLQANSVIVVEAKSHSKPVSDAQFSRFCGILHNQFSVLCRLGIFFSYHGATGFPDRNAIKRQIPLRYSRATQLMYHARTEKFVVVFDQHDLVKLKDSGSLLYLLRGKILEIEKATGFLAADIRIKPPSELSLPPHLQSLIPNTTDEG